MQLSFLAVEGPAPTPKAHKQKAPRPVLGAQQAQMLLPITGGIALGVQGTPVIGAPSRAMQSFIVDVMYAGLPYPSVLAFLSNDEGQVEGYIDSPAANCRFRWDAAHLPKVSHVRYQRVVVQDFVNEVIKAKGAEILAGAGPERLSCPHSAYVSELILDGHVCRPYLARKPLSEDKVIVRGSIRNESKIDPAILPQVRALVAAWNDIVEGYKAIQDLEKFAIWRQGLPTPPKFRQAA